MHNTDDRRVTEENENTDDELIVTENEASGPLPQKRTTEEVRQGHTGDHVRYILAFSFLGAAAALFIAYWFFMK